MHDDLFAPEVLNDPYVYFGQLREEDPLHWNPKHAAWLSTRDDDGVWLTQPPELFSSTVFRHALRASSQGGSSGGQEIFSGMFIRRDRPTHTAIRNARVILLKNERAQWELPGGKLEPGESPEVCVVREITEELRLDVEVTRILDSWLYEITPEVRVLIVTYGCQERTHRAPVLSHEHKQLGWFLVRDVAGLPMPHGYKQSIAHWSRLLRL